MSGKRKSRGRPVEDRLKDLQHEILVAVASGAPLPEVMSLLCRRVEELAQGAICSILRVDSLGRLRPLAAPSLPEAFAQSVDGVAIGPMVGSCGSAAYLGQPVEVVSIRTDPRWAPFRDGPLALGLRACWSSPIKSHDGRVIGTFAFYFRKARRASRLEKRIVGHCAHLCALAIEHWATQARIRRLAYNDPLTRLGNRALVAERLPAVLERAQAAGKEVALFYVDIDDFHAINATRGQKVADELLTAVAKRMCALEASFDLVARLGGDEFLLVETERDGRHGFEATARALGAALCGRYALDADFEVKVTASIGIACFPGDGSDLDTLMGHADTALRRMKSAGGGGHAFYTAEMDAEKRARRAFERDIQAAVAARQFSLVYQPQAEAATSAIKGFEALLRWHHPVLGSVSPAEFIPAAEACGAIEDIGAFVVREALAQAARWSNRLRIAVNVSPAQIVRADFARLVEEALAQSGIDPWRLEIEVTESLFIYEADAALRTLERLKALGVSVAMDDFGTGYSSLSMLRSFPFDRIKIDRSFVFDMTTNRDAAAIVNSILGLGRAMGRPVVAEGVETSEQLELLRAQGCAEVQGYLIGKPLPMEAYAHLTGAAGIFVPGAEQRRAAGTRPLQVPPGAGREACSATTADCPTAAQPEPDSTAAA